MSEDLTPISSEEPILPASDASSAPQEIQDAPTTIPQDSLGTDLRIPEPPAAPALNEDRMVELWGEAQGNDGALTDASYEALGKQGIDRAVVDMTLRGIQAERQLQAQQIADSVGGQDKIQSAFEWASANLPESEVSEINSSLSSSTPSAQAAIVRDLISRAGVGEGGRAVQGQAAQGPQSFESREQMLEAMRDPRYKVDPAYRSEVMSRTRNAAWRKHS
jgi:hypothetical protein